MLVYRGYYCPRGLLTLMRLRPMVVESGLESRLSGVGVTEAAIPGMANEVVTGITRLLETNPRDMTAEDVSRLYQEAL